MKSSNDSLPETVGAQTCCAPCAPHADKRAQRDCAPTRRGFARAALGGLLGLLGVTLVRRSQVCAQGGACDGCALFAACTLPQKVTAASNLTASGGTPLPRQGRP